MQVSRKYKYVHDYSESYRCTGAPNLCWDGLARAFDFPEDQECEQIEVSLSDKQTPGSVPVRVKKWVARSQICLYLPAGGVTVFSHSHWDLFVEIASLIEPSVLVDALARETVALKNTTLYLTCYYYEE